jgi:hypothetical protein
MRRALALFLLALASPAWAGSPLVVTTLPSSKGSQVDSGGTDATDTVNHAVRMNCVTGCAAASSTGTTVTVTPTIQNASYVSGNCMGGFQTVALGATASVLNSASLSSQGGLATAKQIYVFDANPSGSTCTDKSTFTIATADLSKLVTSFTLTPSAPTGTTKTIAVSPNLGFGLPSGGTVYLAIVESTTETPASTTDLVVKLTAF